MENGKAPSRSQVSHPCSHDVAFSRRLRLFQHKNSNGLVTRYQRPVCSKPMPAVYAEGERGDAVQCCLNRPLQFASLYNRVTTDTCALSFSNLVFKWLLLLRSCLCIRDSKYHSSNENRSLPHDTSCLLYKIISRAQFEEAPLIAKLVGAAGGRASDSWSSIPIGGRFQPERLVNGPFSSVHSRGGWGYG